VAGILGPLTCSYECAVRRCTGFQRLAHAAFLSGFLCSTLHSVAAYCVPGGIRVVSILSCISLTLSCTSSSCIHIGQALPHAIDW
jgi:hypothetical protein